MLRVARPVLFVLICSLAGCDCLGCNDDETVENDVRPPDGAQRSTPPPPTQIAVSPAEASATVESDDGETTIRWTHQFDANQIVDAAQCASWLYTVTRAGRLVRYDIKTRSLEHVSGRFHSVTAVNSLQGELIIGTEYGRLSRASCRLAAPTDTPETLYPVRFAQLDPRSRHDRRAFVVFERIPGHPTESEHDPVDSRRLVASHVDLGTGRRIGDEFIVNRAPGARVMGFVDYRGEFWLGLANDEGANSIWSLERFGDQPPVEGLEEAPRLNGFAQVGREVWAYLGSTTSTSGWIVRVDSNRAKTLWDGEKFKSGEYAGGDVPRNQPVTLVTQKGNQLWVLVPDAMYQTDMEMRRWHRRGPRSSEPLFDDIRGWAKRGDGFWVATTHGLVSVEPGGWERQRVPPPPAFEDPPLLRTEADWGGRTYLPTDSGLRVPAPIADDGGASAVEGTVRAIAVDDAWMWVLTETRLYLFGLSSDSVVTREWDTTAFGLRPASVVSLRSAGDGEGIEIRTGDDTRWTLQVSSDGP